MATQQDYIDAYNKINAGGDRNKIASDMGLDASLLQQYINYAYPTSLGGKGGQGTNPLDSLANQNTPEPQAATPVTTTPVTTTPATTTPSTTNTGSNAGNAAQQANEYYEQYTYDDHNIVQPGGTPTGGTTTGTPDTGAAEQAYQEATTPDYGSPTNLGKLDANGNYWTTITNPDGTTSIGYIDANGTSYYQNGQRPVGGAVIHGANGLDYIMPGAQQGTQQGTQAANNPAKQDYLDAFNYINTHAGVDRTAYANEHGLDPTILQQYINFVFTGKGTNPLDNLPTASTNTGGNAGNTGATNIVLPSEQGNTANTPKDYNLVTYIGADGVERYGYIIDGRTYDLDEAPIVGPFYVKGTDGRYWAKDEYGNSREVSEAEYLAARQKQIQGNTNTSYTPYTPQGGGTVEVPTGNTALDFSNIKYNPEESLAEVQAAYDQALQNRPEILFQNANRTTENYQPTDYTEQINQIRDQAFNLAKTQIENQLAQGELDIDQAIAKVPAIYEAGMNDMAQQYEMNKRNMNEYFNANGLTSGAKAQAMLAMNNAYQSNMSAYRMEQANAIQEYEDKRADLKLQAQSAITEALLQNEQSRAQEILAEYQRQDDYNFKWLLQKMDDDYRYYALETDKAVKAASFLEDQRQADLSAAMQLYGLYENAEEYGVNTELNKLKLQQDQDQFDATYALNLAKLNEDARQAQINYELNVAKLNEDARQFNAKNGVSADTIYTPETVYPYDSTGLSYSELNRIAAEYLALKDRDDQQYYEGAIDPADMLSTSIGQFLNQYGEDGWTFETVKKYLQKLGVN